MSLVFDNTPKVLDLEIIISFPCENGIEFDIPKDTIISSIGKHSESWKADWFAVRLFHWDFLNKYNVFNDHFEILEQNRPNANKINIQIGNLVALYLSGIKAITEPEFTYSFDIIHDNKLSEILQFHNLLNMKLSSHLLLVDDDDDEDDEEDDNYSRFFEDDIIIGNVNNNFGPSETNNLGNNSLGNNFDNISEDESLVLSTTSSNHSIENNSALVHHSTPHSNLSTPFSSSASLSTQKRSLSRYLRPKLFNRLSYTQSEDSLQSFNGASDDTVGFLILQIESAKNLPPFRKGVRLGYDMDPFVTCSFSKQIYKTSRCNHTLNPIWKNQYINLRISKYVKDVDFPIRFKIYDHDYFTFNDAACKGDIKLNELNLKATSSSIDWLYKSIPLKLSSSATRKKLTKKGGLQFADSQSSLDIKYKYISMDSLRMYPSFNPKESRCPNCNLYDRSNSNGYKHLSMCASGIKPAYFINKSYTTQSNASRGWYSKLLAHVAYGKLRLGNNNAHILIQHRDTGLIFEEKMSAWVKLGIRLIYKSNGHRRHKIRNLLRSMSLKQGIRYDSPKSKSKINDFIKFFGLNLKDCMIQDISQYETFNDFFTRKLKSGSREIEGSKENSIITSMADSRTTVFDSVNEAQQIWIKGRKFTINKLLGWKSNNHSTIEYSVIIQRLAPQDYHRIHSPLNGKIKNIRHIHGEYYTVNPMAVRSPLDVFCENVRTIVTISTEEYGDVEIVFVGAMMVGSIVMSISKNQYIFKGEELGYFKFGGSTVILLINKDLIHWDGDLKNNSIKGLETLCTVGMSVGHANNVKQYIRRRRTVEGNALEDIERQVTGKGFSLEHDEGPMWDVRELSLLETDVEGENESDKSKLTNSDTLELIVSRNLASLASTPSP